MRTKFLFGIVAVVVVAGIVLAMRKSAQEPETAPTSVGGFTFSRAKKSAHYESNTPSHGSVLPAAPPNVVLDVNFDLAAPSSITISKDGKDYGVGSTTIDRNLLAMRRSMEPSAPDGVYTVSYKACWPDKSCHDGRFQFAIDRNTAGSYEDMRDKKEVVVSMRELVFAPKLLRINRGTRVVWTNNDEAEHYVNTDSHPAHTFYPAQNSRAMKKGDTYAYTFDSPGAYPYHCSAHADTMSATILVE